MHQPRPVLQVLTSVNNTSVFPLSAQASNSTELDKAGNHMCTNPIQPEPRESIYPFTLNKVCSTQNGVRYFAVMANDAYTGNYTQEIQPEGG